MFLCRHTLATHTDVKFILGRSAREARMKRNRIAVGHLGTAHSFLSRMCRDENCLAAVRPKMVEKLQDCVRQWHDAVAATSKRDKVRALTMKLREHSLANEGAEAHSAKIELDALRATKITSFNPQVHIDEDSSVQQVERAIRVCADMVAEAVRSLLPLPPLPLPLPLLVLPLPLLLLTTVAGAAAGAAGDCAAE
jgi:hypothetical protein